ncbi:MAG TPA: PQQ-binding-like beta-propeller repeat protein [Gemmataceae bacterium]|jgi:outer membrane protein assembly factor BamB|nr:PQQ-binding-like beta-propeller repeat protein [Gemmataceae bacterium]
MSNRIALLTLALSSPTLLAADWDRFRGPGGLGTTTGANIPVSIGPKEILWKTPIPGRGASSPIISKGKVFIESSSPDNMHRLLMCIDAASGKVDWSKEVKGGPASHKTHEKSTLASSTPAADGEHIYAVFWDGTNISITGWDYAGKQLWSTDLGKFTSQHGPGLSPMVVGDRVILNVDQDGLAEVQAFDPATGNLVWKKSRRAYRASYATPIVLERDGKKEVLVSSTAGVTAYDPKDGAVNWNWTWTWKSDKGGPGGALRNVGGPIYYQGLIYLTSGDGAGDRRMVAIKAGTSGEVTDPIVWEKTKGTAYVPMVIPHGEYVYWIGDKENVAVCANAKTGKVEYTERLPGAKSVTASPVLIDDKIYSVNEDGRVCVFAASPKFKLLGDSELKEEVYASPAVADGKLYIRGANNLFCIGAKK